MRRFLATLDRALERLADLAYGALPEGEKPAGLLTKLGCLALFGLLLAVGIGSCQMRHRDAQAERDRARQVEEGPGDGKGPGP
jgi:hypothetical protein